MIKLFFSSFIIFAAVFTQAGKVALVGDGYGKHEIKLIINQAVVSPEVTYLYEQLRLVNYDPSVSPKINPRIISETIQVPFQWRLCNFHYPELSVREVSDFVYQAAADGASNVLTSVCHGMCNNESVEKVHSFIAACKEVERILAQGGSRDEIRAMVSESGSKKFWNNWPQQVA